jgi:hypothetical protein
MKKFEVLRAVVVLQALCMIALTGRGHGEGMARSRS